AADSSARQIQDVHTLLDSGIDLLIISPNQSEALSPVVAEAYRRIPVILLDRSVVGFNYTLFIGPDNRLIGKQAGQYVASLLGANGGKIVEILGRSGSPPVLDRSIGFQEAIAQQGNISIVDTLVADWLRDKAEDELTSWLRKNGPVDVIMAQNDAMADGARRAAMKLGIQGLHVVGIDGLPGPGGGIELVKSGALAATFTCPTGGKEAVISALDILHQEEGIPKKMILRTSLVTRQSIESGALAASSPRPRLPGPDHRIVLGFAQVGKESDWRLANTESIKTAAREAGIELLFRDGEQKQENQIKAIREFIAKKVDVIAFSANVESGWGEVLREAKAAGIPVFIIDRPVDEKDESLWVSLMGSDFVEEGRRAAHWLLQYLNTEKPVNIVELQGTIGSAPAIDRKIGFEEVLKDHPNYRIIVSQSGDFFRSVGREVMQQILRELSASNQRMDVLFAHNDDMAIGAIAAMEAMGLKPGRDVVIVSVDGIRDAFKAMIAGRLNCSVECSPLLGPQLMKAVKDYLSGKDLPVRIVTSEVVFPAEVARVVLPTRKY
ncbi:MAG TPA: substrate-binding domain-containing protein, partial [Anaerolineales bacterium]|nr:substrate-binding domain-containing protein [Anaerolineales bacterium]